MALIRPSGRPPAVRLSRDLVRSIRRGHPWVFADSLQNIPDVAPGTPTLLQDKRGKPVALGYLDPKGPLAFRVCIPNGRAKLDDAWADAQMGRALSLRTRLFAGYDAENNSGTNGYRLFHGEGDGLPGLVCDIYGDAAVLRMDGPIAEAFWDAEGIAAWLVAHVPLTHVYQRHRSRGGPSGKPLIGGIPDGPMPFIEHGVRYISNIVVGQKTGFFLDQRENRNRVRTLSKDLSVLNIFGYTGGFSIAGLAGGATHATTVDIAPAAIEAANAHAELNGFTDRHTGVAEDAFAYLDRAVTEKNQWGVVVLDPPSFAPNQKAVPAALSGYKRLAEAGARVTEPGGYLVAASCSSHVSERDFEAAVADGVGAARRRATVIGVYGQPEDHPTPLAFPEFRYLKAVFLRLDGGQ